MGPSLFSRIFGGTGDSGSNDPADEAAAEPDVRAALRKIEIVTARMADLALSGNYRSSFKGQGLAFREVRPYQPGDDVRSIDWNVSARMHEAYVKVFQEEREMTVMLAVDRSESEIFGTRRASKAFVATEVSALVAFSAIKHNDRVGLILGGERVGRIVAPKRGEKHVMRVVREVLTFRREPPPRGAPRQDETRQSPPLGARTDLRGLLESLVRVCRRRSVAFVVSDFFAEGYDDALAIAARKHDLIPVVLTDPRDLELPDVGLSSFRDPESGASVVVDTSDRGVRAHYKQFMRDLVAARAKRFRRLGLDAVTVTTDGSTVDPFRALFARRARKRRG
jgi:uncharacterized protein (DUF58 family)